MLKPNEENKEEQKFSKADKLQEKNTILSKEIDSILEYLSEQILVPIQNTLLWIDAKIDLIR